MSVCVSVCVCAHAWVFVCAFFTLHLLTSNFPTNIANITVLMFNFPHKPIEPVQMDSKIKMFLKIKDTTEPEVILVCQM